MMWKTAKLGEHCTVTSSKRCYFSQRVANGIPFYRSKEIIQIYNGQEVEECDYIPTDQYNQIKNKFGVPQKGDLLLTTRGTIGIPYIYKGEDCFYFADGNLTWMKDFSDKLYPLFIYYWVISRAGAAKIDAIAVGAAQKAVPIVGLKNMAIPLPPLKIQCCIANILSAYDDLIENNQKQIKLLEEAAMRLYNEWFVNLRFPGFEKTSVVDGVPEGWRKGKLIDKTCFKRGKTITKESTRIGTVPVVAGGLAPAYFHDQANTKAPVITVSASGANAGYVMMYNQDIWASDCSYIDSTFCNCFYFIYTFLKSSNHTISNLQRGAAQPHVYPKDINALELLIPTEELIFEYNKIVESMFMSIGNLQRSCDRSIQARNRLLPKLMSGEIEV